MPSTARGTLAAVRARLVDRLARPLASRRAPAPADGDGSRRDLFRKAAVAGTALAVAPKEFILTPVTAHAAICSCNGYSCDCGSLCCDGYTEFCCTTTGVNWCPSGAVTGGWWKVDASSYCGGANRYYLDCHRTCGGCACSGGFCSGSCNGTTCGCAGGSCGNRKSGCTRFRYGQCNTQISCLGPIVCRVVSCTPAWQLDDNCSTAALTDNNTRYHHRPCLEQQPGQTFYDVPSGRYYSEPVEWANRHEITTGVGGSKYFKPFDTVIRAEAITFLWRFWDRPYTKEQAPFPDVPNGAYYERAVNWGYRKHIVEGVGDTNRFQPDSGVTRAQYVTMLWRMMGAPPQENERRFGDVPPGSWFGDAVAWADRWGITTGDGNSGYFRPNRVVSRAEAVTFLWRLAGKERLWDKQEDEPDAVRV